MDRFEYVMVLISIIIGLGLTHLLQGIGGIIQRRTGQGPPLSLSWAHSLWIAYLFLWMVLFWWWEFRFFELDAAWTLGLYLFLVIYAVSLFLLAVIIVPASWDGVTDLNEFFLARRGWFYSFFLLVDQLDLLDSYLKNGWDYIVSLGPLTWLLYVSLVVMCILGIRSRDLRVHRFGAASLLLLQIMQSFATLPRLGF